MTINYNEPGFACQCFLGVFFGGRMLIENVSQAGMFQVLSTADPRAATSLIVCGARFFEAHVITNTLFLAVCLSQLVDA